MSQDTYHLNIGGGGGRVVYAFLQSLFTRNKNKFMFFCGRTSVIFF